MPKTLRDFLFEEGLRQDALIHAVSSQLGTKNGLFMVFAAFVFTAESTLANVGDKVGWQILRPALWFAALFSLVGIAILLRCAFLENYRMPPILPMLRAQAAQFLQLPDVRTLSEEEKMVEFQGKFINSLSRSVEANFNTNAHISRNLEWASAFVAVSILCLLLALLWFPCWQAFLFFVNCL